MHKLKVCLQIYKQIKLIMSKIPEFDKFNETIVAAGFGQMGINNFALGGATPQTGYSMTPISGVVESCSNHVAEQANMYETNDNDDHTAESYMKEAKKHINEAMDEAYESYKATNEAMVQVAGKDKPSGAKVLASVIVNHLMDKKLVTRAGEKKLTAEIQDLIIKSTF
jgi:GTP1/Obg family GTP-binding protein|tara:strand:+ start:3313 stop:3816 length:504 start_codon:yes stop_codon:yes gene_type:complete